MLRYEWKKLFSRKINRIILFTALLLAIVFSVFAAKSVYYVDDRGNMHTDITAARKLTADRSQWEGELTPECFMEIVQNQKQLEQKYADEVPDAEYGKTVQSYHDIMDFIISVFTPDSEYDESILYQISDDQIENLYKNYKASLHNMVKIYGNTAEQQALLEKQYAKISMPLHYQTAVSWDNLIMYAETYGIVLAVIIGFLASGIFSEEFQIGAELVYFSTKYGRTKAAKTKIIAGFFMATLVYWTGIGLLSLVSFGIMGTSGFHTPYQIDQPYSIYVMTYGQYYLLILLSGYIATLLAASVTMLTAAKMHTANVAICIPFFLYCIMPFIGRAFSSSTSLFHFTPDLLNNILDCAKSPTFFQAGSIVCRQIPFIMGFYSILAILFIPLIYRSFHQYGRK